jgi:hypothetical protein
MLKKKATFHDHKYHAAVYVMQELNSPPSDHSDTALGFLKPNGMKQ